MEILPLVGQYISLSTFLVAASVFLMTYWYLRSPRNLPPGPWGWPILGNIPLVLWHRADFFPDTITDLAETYGDVMSFWFGRDLGIFVSGYGTIRHALTRRADEFSSRTAPRIFVDLRGDGTSDTTTKGVIFAAYDEQWKQQRKFTAKTLRNFGVGKRSLEAKICEEAGALSQEVMAQNGQSFDIKAMMQNAASNIICSIVFGERFESSDPEFLQLIGLLNVFVTVDPSQDILPQIHSAFRHLPFGTANHQKFTNATLQLQTLCKEKIQEHRATFNQSHMRDLIDAFLLEQQRANGGEADGDFTDKQLQELILDLFIAGTETSATTISWALLYMLLNPDVQAKVHQEIDSVLGQAAPSYAYRDKMPYTTATLAEVQRINTVGPFALPHVASKDTTLNGYSIPGGTVLLINLWSVHMDPEIFPDPRKFNPDRFLDQDGNFKKHEALIPFSVGPRVCLGEQLARMEVFLFFVFLMQRFSFDLPEGAPPPSTKGAMESVINMPRPYQLSAVSRG